MSDLPDAELLAHWCSGDRDAFAVLVSRYYGLVQAACRRQAASGDDEDCTQAVFLILARKPSAAARAPALAAWLQRTAWFVCEHARRSSRRRQQVEQATRLPTNGMTTLPSEALDHLDDCLLKLPEKQRAAVTLHYLDGKSPDEVGNLLGTNRTNAYQLISRGLAGLRVLLARRGVVVAEIALVSVLAAEAQAASSSAPTAVIASVSGTPSVTATTFANGAMKAMTLSDLTPIAVAAGLVLAVGMFSLALSAEAAPSTPPAPNGLSSNGVVPATTSGITGAVVGATPSPGQRDDSSWRRTLEKQLDQEITLDLHDQDLTEVLVTLKKLTQVNFLLEPKAVTTQHPPITLKVDRMLLRQVLDRMMRQTSLHYTVRDAAIFITLADPPPPAPARVGAGGIGLHLEGSTIELQEKLDKRVTLDFTNASIDDVYDALRQLSGIDFTISPEVVSAKIATTLQVEGMHVDDAIRWLSEFQKVSISVQDGTLSVKAPIELPISRNTHASQLAYSNAVTELIDEKSGTKVEVAADGRVLSATDASGKNIWQVDVVSLLGHVPVGAPVIRTISLDPQGKILVVVGKHDYVQVDILSGKAKYLGSD